MKSRALTNRPVRAPMSFEVCPSCIVQDLQTLNSPGLGRATSQVWSAFRADGSKSWISVEINQMYVFPNARFQDTINGLDCHLVGRRAKDARHSTGARRRRSSTCLLPSNFRVPRDAICTCGSLPPITSRMRGQLYCSGYERCMKQKFPQYLNAGWSAVGIKSQRLQWD